MRRVPLLTGVGLMHSLLKTLKCHRIHSHSEKKIHCYIQSILKSLQTYMIYLVLLIFLRNSSSSSQKPLEHSYIYLSNQCIVHAAENSGWASFFFRLEKAGWKVNTSYCFCLFEPLIPKAVFSWLGIPVDQAA